MIYTIDRETAAAGLATASRDELTIISKRVELLGIRCTVSG